MVRSGLKQDTLVHPEDPRVSPYRLATHVSRRSDKTSIQILSAHPITHHHTLSAVDGILPVRFARVDFSRHLRGHQVRWDMDGSEGHARPELSNICIYECVCMHL